MITSCSQCGAVYEVSESQKSSYMFCLECDKFFRVREQDVYRDDKSELAESESFTVEDKKISGSLVAKLRNRLNGFFAGNLSESDAQKIMPDADEIRPRALLNDFLVPGDSEEESDGVTDEYLDFLDIDLDISSPEDSDRTAP